MADTPLPESGGDEELTLDQAVQMMATPADAEPASQDAPTEPEQESEPTDEATQETPEETTQEEATEQEAEVAEAPDDVLVKLADGTTKTVAELRSYVTEAEEVKAEATRVSQEAAKVQREVQEIGKGLSETLEGVIQYLVSKLPPEPDKNLIWTDAARHHQELYIREQAIAELSALLSPKEAVDQTVAKLTEDQRTALWRDEDAKLVQALPVFKDAKRFEAAKKEMRDYAISIGFTAEEIDNTADSRVRRMAIDAAYGRRARAEADKARAQVKSPVAQPTKKAVHPNSMKAIQDVNGLRRLQQSERTLDDGLKFLLGK